MRISPLVSSLLFLLASLPCSSPLLSLTKTSRRSKSIPQSSELHDKQARNREVSSLFLKQLLEFKQLGKFQLSQIRSQFDYGSVYNNTRMNIDFQLRKVGILAPQSRSDNNTICYDEIGCIEISEKWYDVTRPVNLLPLDRYVINTQFILATRDNPQERVLSVVDPRALLSSGFNASKPIKFIVHGFIDTGFETWVKDLTEALLEVEDCLVIAVDWGGGSLPLYSQAAANTRVVGLELAYFINTLVAECGVKAENIHIIGHSLGAHIAGYAGERVQGLGRISGLDPAEPLFQGMPGFVRLDPSDAEFVDVIHTDSRSILMGGYGMSQAVGHVDFYPNGGETQPGCSLLSLSASLSSMSVEDISFPSPDTMSRYLVACAHTRVIYLYTDSLKQGRSCPMVGYLCSSYEEFQVGGCLQCGETGDRCSILGYYATKPQRWKPGDTRTMYLETGATSPYCQYSYKVELELGRSPETEDWVQGSILVNLYGEKGELNRHRLTQESGSERFDHGERKTFRLSLNKNIGPVSIAEIYWEYDHEIDPFDLCKMCLIFCSDSLHIDSVAFTSFTVDKEMRVRSDKRVLCGEELKPIRSGHSKLFYKNCPPR